MIVCRESNKSNLVYSSSASASSMAARQAAAKASFDMTNARAFAPIRPFGFQSHGFSQTAPSPFAFF